jgi:hypothetical protein
MCGCFDNNKHKQAYSNLRTVNMSKAEAWYHTAVDQTLDQGI